MKRGLAGTSKGEKPLNISFSHRRGREGPPRQPFSVGKTDFKAGAGNKLRQAPPPRGCRASPLASTIRLVVGPVWAKRCGVEFTSQDTLQVIPFRCAVQRKPLPRSGTVTHAFIRASYKTLSDFVRTLGSLRALRAIATRLQTRW